MRMIVMLCFMCCISVGTIAQVKTSDFCLPLDTVLSDLKHKFTYYETEVGYNNYWKPDLYCAKQNLNVRIYNSEKEMVSALSRNWAVAFIKIKAFDSSKKFHVVVNSSLSYMTKPMYEALKKAKLGLPNKPELFLDHVTFDIHFDWEAVTHTYKYAGLSKINPIKIINGDK